MLIVDILILLAGVGLLVLSIVLAATGGMTAGPITMLVASIILLIVGSILAPRFFALEPNEARVLVLFGDYRGTVLASGFHWANPFYSNGPPSGQQTQAGVESPAGSQQKGKA